VIFQNTQPAHSRSLTNGIRLHILQRTETAGKREKEGQPRGNHAHMRRNGGRTSSATPKHPGRFSPDSAADGWFETSPYTAMRNDTKYFLEKDDENSMAKRKRSARGKNCGNLPRFRAPTTKIDELNEKISSRLDQGIHSERAIAVMPRQPIKTPPKSQKKKKHARGRRDPEGAWGGIFANTHRQNQRSAENNEHRPSTATRVYTIYS